VDQECAGLSREQKNQLVTHANEIAGATYEEESGTITPVLYLPSSTCRNQVSIQDSQSFIGDTARLDVEASIDELRMDFNPLASRSSKSRDSRRRKCKIGEPALSKTRNLFERWRVSDTSKAYHCRI